MCEYLGVLAMQDTAGQTHFSPAVPRFLRRDLHNWGERGEHGRKHKNQGFNGSFPAVRSSTSAGSLPMNQLENLTQGNPYKLWAPQEPQEPQEPQGLNPYLLVL